MLHDLYNRTDIQAAPPSFAALQMQPGPDNLFTALVQFRDTGGGLTVNTANIAVGASGFEVYDSARDVWLMANAMVSGTLSSAADVALAAVLLLLLLFRFVRELGSYLPLVFVCLLAPDTILVSTVVSSVTSVTHLRYGWYNFPILSVFSVSGLPALAFNVPVDATLVGEWTPGGPILSKCKDCF